MALPSRSVRGLYPIVDLEALCRFGIHPLRFTEQVLSVRPPLLQLRAKQASPQETLGLLRAMRPLCSRAGTQLYANDRPDLAVAARCDGVHVGQADLGIREVRRFAAGLRVGLSTHDERQLEAALGERPDYVAYGPVFETRSKDSPDAAVGLQGLERAAERAHRAGTVLVAIGGIDRGRAGAVARHADLIAVIAALLPEGPDPDEVGTQARVLNERVAAVGW